MTIKQLEVIFEQNKDKQKSIKMEAYLRNQFKFLGISKPERSSLEKKFINENKIKSIDKIMEIVVELHNKEYREYMYTAQNLLLAVYKKLTIKEIFIITDLTLINSWWENTDGYIGIIKRWLKVNPEYIEKYVKQYYTKKDFWLRRAAIICQLSLKEKVNFEMMKLAIEENIVDNEFFIQKAIGWALRDYSKYNKEDVLNFVNLNKDSMSNLAIKEASKYL